MINSWISRGQRQGKKKERENRVAPTENDRDGKKKKKDKTNKLSLASD